jgi:hypothetical protein
MDPALHGYQYAPWVTDELKVMCRGLFPGLEFQMASRADDLRGVDVYVIVNHHAAMQIRCRFDRPKFASDIDVTFRDTEPAMMTAHTYAPLALFAWFRGHRIHAAKLIDVYRMADAVSPSIADRSRWEPNVHGGPGFCKVRIGELHDVGAVLRASDGAAWITECFDGDDRVRAIVCPWRQVALRL